VKNRGVFFAALLLGLFVRVAALPLPGTEDVLTWKIWAFDASRHVTQVYGVGGDPPVRGVVRWNALQTTVDYPPAALYELGLVGLVYRLIDPAFADSSSLTAAIKLPGLLCGIALTALLAWSAKRFSGDDRAAAWVALAYWLNPATILNAEVLGYLDPLMLLPGIASLVAIHLGALESAGVALALAVLTKPQGIFLLPACGLAAWHTARARGLARVAAGAGLGGTVLVLPFALVGALPNMWLAFGSFYARRDILSGNAANLWWIVNYAVRAYYQIPRLGFPHAFFVEVRRIMAVSTLQNTGFPNPRPFAAAAVLGTSTWGLWQLRCSRGLAAHALASAFVVHAFFVLGVGVHEHHMMVMVPLLALAAALEPSLRPLFYVVSAIVALNMNLFYGIGIGRGWSVPRLMLGIDLSVLLSIANIAALVWHGRIVRSWRATVPYGSNHLLR
jgi:Gpi18-like mannosyltransferase